MAPLLLWKGLVVMILSEEFIKARHIVSCVLILMLIICVAFIAIRELISYIYPKIKSWLIMDGDIWYRNCYRSMEYDHIAAFGCCRGTNNKNDFCYDCPYYVDCEDGDLDDKI